jgi:retron-type reverse transcriptase
MKRHGHLYQQIYSIENLYRADQKARKGKAGQYGVQLHMRQQDENLHALHLMLRDKTYRTSPYVTFHIYEPKEREVYRLPFFPDRLAHHAIMNVLEPIFISHFTADTYSCIKGKGIHAAAYKLRDALRRDEEATAYCLKLDIKKFYPSVDHDILKALLQRKFKDADLLELLYEIIDSAPGLPIGNYLSQYLANYYLSFFDHWIKEVCGVRHYFRYADDLVILGSSKQDLHALLADIRSYLWNNLRLEVKGNYQVFPVESRGIDFLGYVFYHTHVRVRKHIKQSYARKLARGAAPASLAAYYGWLKHCHSRHLLKTLITTTKTHDPIQRPRYQSRYPGSYRRQDQNRADTEQGGHGNSLSHRTIEA